jgi:hypothetical protein
LETAIRVGDLDLAELVNDDRDAQVFADEGVGPTSEQSRGAGVREQYRPDPIEDYQSLVTVVEKDLKSRLAFLKLFFRAPVPFSIEIEVGFVPRAIYILALSGHHRIGQGS